MKILVYRFISVMVCLSGIMPAFAQNDFNRAKMDSLSRILRAQQTTKDSILVLQQLVDATPIVEGEVAAYPDYLTKLLELNSKVKTIDPVPYQLINDGNHFWKKRQYKETLNCMQAAVTEFDKQHKIIYPLLFNMRVLYGYLNNQEDRLRYYQQKLEYYQVNGPYENTAPCYHALGGYYLFKGAYNQAINNYLKGAGIFKRFNPHYYVPVLSVVGTTYGQWGNSKRAILYTSGSLRPVLALKDTPAISYAYYCFSRALFEDHQYQKALENLDKAYYFETKIIPSKLRMTGYMAFKAEIYFKLGLNNQALPLLNRARVIADSAGYKTVSNFGNIEIDYEFFEYYNKTADEQKAAQYLLQAYKAAKDQNGVPLQLKYLRELGYFYKKQGDTELAAKYFDLYFNTYDARENTLEDFKTAQYEVDQNDKTQREHINQLKQEKVIQDYQISRRNSLLWGSLVVLFLISALLVFIYRQLQVNKKTLASLRQTQTQLIQSEKMASLGELTAGIAHEIQNPLNFVNNFSEVNTELIDELRQEIDKDDLDEVKSIVGDIKANQQKISQHGKRADFIVKGMLEHSRTSRGENQPTNINLLADEFFRLSYHGLRAKDKSFNAELITDFEENLPKPTVAQQDIGRVLLNLFNNAFYAVNEKSKTAGPDYKPTVEVNTLSKNGSIEIKVKDNGNGIPDAIKDKIMQPFFTTKPTGEGTGLGLSLSYDIVVKGHGGSIDMESKPNEYTVFTVKLPIAG